MTSLRKINVLRAAQQQIGHPYDPYIVGEINDAQMKVARFEGEFTWHAHEHEDEAFFVLSGSIAIDFRDGNSVQLDEGDVLIVPRTVEHRPRGLSAEPIVLLFEPASTLNTGDAQSERTVRSLKRLRPES